ncbi:MAG: UDP-N-acetylglucosamine 2-epimerase (hydrolyzing) [Muribaculaceae bacterium]|nr:UDP-N-acetylglucosamine 2-epimerase (hydrolyzing) [Muribaculaceae bacterium]
MKKKVCVFTGTRAEYGILSSLMRGIDEHPDMELQIVATNMHLSPEYGLTINEIRRDGFKVDKCVEMLLSSDTPTGTAKSVGLGIIGFADALAELQPDLVLILGDRYEMLGVAQTATLFNIPIAHLHGGEITEGAYDDCIRHAITKLSHLHFTSTEEYRRRVIQMGENPERVFNVGALGVDNILNTKLLSVEELSSQIGFDFSGDYLMCTFHPTTTEPGEAERQTDALLNVLKEMLSDIKVVITLPNSDSEGRLIAEKMRQFADANKDRVLAVQSMGRVRYYSAVAGSKGVIGNSSSGLIEAPSLGVPTLNIGNRQKGRARGLTVIDCECNEGAIRQGIKLLLSPFGQSLHSDTQNPNPYAASSGESTLKSILSVLASTDFTSLVPKAFHDL